MKIRRQKVFSKRGKKNLKIKGRSKHINKHLTSKKNNWKKVGNNWLKEKLNR